MSKKGDHHTAHKEGQPHQCTKQPTSSYYVKCGLKNCNKYNSKKISKRTPRYHKRPKSNWLWRRDISEKIYMAHCGYHWLHKNKTRTESRLFPKRKQNKSSEKDLYKRKVIFQLTFIFLDYQKQWPQNDLKTMASKLGLAIWSRDTAQWISCFDRYQLTITWVSNIKRDVTNRGCMSLST